MTEFWQDAVLVKCFRLLDVTVCKIAAAQSGNFDHPWCGQVGEAAGKVHVPPFEPRQGVQIETDPKATSVSSAAALGDDEGVIDSLIKRLEVCGYSHAP